MGSCSPRARRARAASAARSISVKRRRIRAKKPGVGASVSGSRLVVVRRLAVQFVALRPERHEKHVHDGILRQRTHDGAMPQLRTPFRRRSAPSRCAAVARRGSALAPAPGAAGGRGGRSSFPPAARMSGCSCGSSTASTDVTRETRVRLYPAGRRGTPIKLTLGADRAYEADVPVGLYDVQAVRSRCRTRSPACAGSSACWSRSIPTSTGRHLQVVNLRDGFGALQIRPDRAPPRRPAGRRSRRRPACPPPRSARRASLGPDLLLVVPAGTYDVKVILPSAQPAWITGIDIPDAADAAEDLAAQAVGLQNSQLPKANAQGTPNSQLPSQTGGAVGSWKLGVPWKLVIGSWKLRRPLLRRPASVPTSPAHRPGVRASAASTGARPCRRRGSAAGRRRTRWRSAPGSGSGAVPASAARMRAVASQPSISGIWQSISTMSNVPALARSNASRPFTATSAWCPSRSSIRDTTFWFTSLSSATRTRRPPGAGAARSAIDGVGSGDGGTVARHRRLQRGRRHGGAAGGHGLHRGDQRLRQLMPPLRLDEARGETEPLGVGQPLGARARRQQHGRQRRQPGEPAGGVQRDRAAAQRHRLVDQQQMRPPAAAPPA